MKSSAPSKSDFLRAFNEAWEEAYSRLRPSIDGIYEKRTEWNKLMFGAKPAALENRSLLARTLERLKVDDKPVLFDPERHKVDVFGRIFIEESRREHAGYINVVMIEVENDTEHSYEEFWKLLHSRCPLRVLITYEHEKSHVHTEALARYARMYKAAVQYLGEDNPDAYLVIIGTRSAAPERKIEWMPYEFDGEVFSCKRWRTTSVDR